MLHLIDQYDSLYPSALLSSSEVSESRLKQLNLNHEWTAEKLCRSCSAMPGAGWNWPSACSRAAGHGSELSEVEALRLEAIGDITFPPGLSQLVHLQELSLLHSPACSFRSPRRSSCGTA